MNRPSEALEMLNQALLRHDSDRFVTAVLLRLQLREVQWTVTIATAGHPLPLIARAGLNPVPHGVPGSLLGVMLAVAIEDVPVVLQRGDTLVIYTDGVTEARCDDDFFGDARLRESIAEHAGSAASVTEGLLADVLAFQDGYAHDDIAIVTLRVPAADTE